MLSTEHPPLVDTSVLVTRPAHQAEEFCRMIEAEGGTAIRFPVIEVAPASDKAMIEQRLQDLSRYNIAIFISANAVKHALACGFSDQSEGLKIAAVGNKTAASLRAHGIAVSILPKSGFNTEALLALPLLQCVADKRIAIIRGVGGRETLAQTLTDRGAQVDYIEVYQRHLPKQRLVDVIDYQNCDIIAVTSQEGLRNLITLCDDKAWLFTTALACNSQRTAKLAEELGFRRDIVTSLEPGDEAMKAAIVNWRRGTNELRQ